MSVAFWKQFVRDRRFEASYTAAGVALGGLVFGAGLAADGFGRRVAGSDLDLVATFLASPAHCVNLAVPLVLGRVFFSIGRMRRRMVDAVRMANETEAAARERASRDTVTGLLNRPRLLGLMEEGIATREWERRRALLFLLDLDDFKLVNDTYGHHAGDLVLATTARRVASLCGPDDLAVRLGGDEFVVVHFPDAPGDGAAAAFAKRLLSAVGGEIILHETRVVPGTSVGIARIGVDGTTCSDVLNAADLALYRAKLETGSAFRHFDQAMRIERDRRQALEEEMRRGIERGEFFLQFQPIYGTASGAIRSFEALVRWRHPERGVVPPSDFIPLAESTGLILKLGRRILQEACRTAKTWPKPIGVSVNLSPVQFNDPDLVVSVEAALREAGLAPGRLDIEITESMLLESTGRTQSLIAQLKALGVRITIDDFGTGYSSLGTLRNFAFDRLKIDRSFTRDLASDADDAEIVRTIVRLSRTMRMETILEGVETKDQLAFARSEGLTEVQGFLYSKPLSAEDAAALFEAAPPRQVAEVA